MEQMREKYESLSAFVLKDLAKARGIKGVSSLKKGQIMRRTMHRHTSRRIWFSPACEARKRVTHYTSKCYRQQATPRHPLSQEHETGSKYDGFPIRIE